MRGAMIRLSELLTATGGGSPTEDRFGNIDGATTEFNFFGNVSKKKSPRVIDSGKRRDTEVIVVVARSSEVEVLDIGYSLTWEGESKNYQVVDIREADHQDRGINSKFKSYVEIEAKYIS